MSLVLQFNAEIIFSCKVIKFTETTGIYSSVNTTGWGSPNDDIATATSANLTILTPVGNSYTFNVFPSSFPSNNSLTPEYSIDSSMIGYGTNQKLPDGVYRFTYEVITAKGPVVVTYSQVKEFLFYCNAQCCVSNMFADIDFECSCSEDKQNKAKKAYLMLKGLEYAACCGLTDYFEDLLSDINKICKNNCSNC